MKTVLITIMFIITISSNSYALNVKNSCDTLQKCLETVSKLTGAKYFYSGMLKGKLVATSNLTLTKKNADKYFSQFLHINGYARIPTDDNYTYNLIPLKDIRYSAIKQILTSYKEKLTLPNTYDYYMVTYQLQHIDGQELTRNFRPFMTRYGRLINLLKHKQLIIQDTAININRLLKMIRNLDQPMSEADKKKLEQKNRLKRELAIIRAENCKDNKIKNSK